MEQNSFCSSSSERLVLLLGVFHLFRTIATTRRVCRRVGSGDCIVGHAQSLIQTIRLAEDLRHLLLLLLLVSLFFVLTAFFLLPTFRFFFVCLFVCSTLCHSFYHFVPFISSSQDSPCPPPLPLPGGDSAFNSSLGCGRSPVSERRSGMAVWNRRFYLKNKNNKKTTLPLLFVLSVSLV